MARGVPGSSIIWIGVAIVVVAYAWWLSSQVDVARGQASQAQAREQALVMQVQQLAAQPGADQARSGTPDALAVALVRRPDLIPLAPQVGGRFYFLENTEQVLSDRYLYVQVEDGHVTGHVLLAYTRDG